MAVIGGLYSAEDGLPAAKIQLSHHGVGRMVR
jgi:hypothetical protein